MRRSTIMRVLLTDGPACRAPPPPTTGGPRHGLGPGAHSATAPRSPAVPGAPVHGAHPTHAKACPAARAPTTGGPRQGLGPGAHSATAPKPSAAPRAPVHG